MQVNTLNQNQKFFLIVILIYVFVKIRWLFGKVGCDLSAFIMYTVGCSSIHMLAALSVQR